MRRTLLFLEAWRRELYNWLPVPSDWHENYERGKVKIKHCILYYACPINAYTEDGKLSIYWIEEYCLVNNKNCLRFQMEEKGQYHPDNMLPNGEIREDL